MLLDHFLYTLDEAALTRHLPLLAGTLDFFARHYGSAEMDAAAAAASAGAASSAGDAASAASGKASPTLRIFPTQALETYQCWLPPTEQNCPRDDHPTVAALHVLTLRFWMSSGGRAGNTTTRYHARCSSGRATIPETRT